MYNPNLHFHFTGIGGSGMSGIAEILLDLGFQVSGSDLRYSNTCRRLESLGAVISEGHATEHLPLDSSLLVYSSAVSPDNPEVVEALRRKIPVVRRAEVLAELMRLKFGVAVGGSHGKTTTTSMIASVMEGGALDPTVIIGGQVKSIGTGGKLGKGSYLVAESDESDRSFLLLRPTIAVVTNIDYEHMTAYQSFDDLKESFRKFVSAVPFYGLAVLCIDNPHVRELTEAYAGRQVTYGFSDDAEIRADRVEIGNGRSEYHLVRDGEELGLVTLPLPGRHFVQNSLAAVAVGLEFGVPFDSIQESLAGFAGVSRRLEVMGKPRGIMVINDYGHHPTEIIATLDAVRSGWKEHMRDLHVVFQPHRYTRTRECFSEFVEAFRGCDHLYISDIYAAGEQPLEGISSERLCESIQDPQAEYVPELSELGDVLRSRVEEGDIVLCLGAGSIGTAAEKLVVSLG